MRPLLLLLALPALAFAQGSLTPPGTPAPSMKTLAQIEPRTPVETGSAGISAEANGGYTIFRPGSYYLTGNLTISSGDGIIIAASEITLDLNGFTISSTAIPAVGNAIYLPTAQQNIAIRNGHLSGGTTVNTAGAVTGAGFLNGIYCNAFLANCLITDLTVRGMNTHGLYLDIGSTIDRCVVTACGSIGIRANTVSNSNGGSALSSGILAFYSANNCYGQSTNSPGIDAKNVSNSYGKSANGHGISATTVTGSTGESTAKNGIHCTVAADSSGTSIAGIGLFATTATNCHGTSSSSSGLSAQEATNCHGKTKTGTRGLDAASTASGCTGFIGPDENDPPGSIPSVAGAIALFADTASNCTGTITLAGTNGCALQATVANTCTGRVTSVDTGATGTCGLRANTVMNSFGNCPAGTGLLAHLSATGCQGFSTSGIGLSANGVATNCSGTSTSNFGLQAASANTCTATTTSGSRALSVYGTASGCYGLHAGNGVAISAAITIGCVAQQGSIIATNRYNMP